MRGIASLGTPSFKNAHPTPPNPRLTNGHQPNPGMSRSVRLSMNVVSTPLCRELSHRMNLGCLAAGAGSTPAQRRFDTHSLQRIGKSWIGSFTNGPERDDGTVGQRNVHLRALTHGSGGGTVSIPADGFSLDYEQVDLATRWIWQPASSGPDAEHMCRVQRSEPPFNPEKLSEDVVEDAATPAHGNRPASWTMVGMTGSG